jgi:hypothetical protein
MAELDGKMGLYWDEDDGAWRVYARFDDWEEGYDFDQAFETVAEAAAHLLAARVAREQFKLDRHSRVLGAERAELEKVELQMLLVRTHRAELKQIKAQFENALNDLRLHLKSDLGSTAG